MNLATAVYPHPLHLLPLPATSSRSFLPLRRRTAVPIRCSISQIHNYGTVDFERKPALNWSSLYRRIAMIQDPAASPGSVLDRWEEEERRLTKWALCRIAKELRKFRRFKLALQVYDWMSAQGDRFVFTSSDMAIKLDLIAKVYDITEAEKHFSMLDDVLKDKRTYGALLNVYGHAKMKGKAEATLETMRNNGYATEALPFNVMMTLYMNVGEHQEVITIINEMKEKNVRLDVFSYNIWITNCAAMGHAEEMERVVGLMTSDSSINANWTTYTTLATMYIKLGDYEKAYSCLQDAEIRMTGRGRIPFNYLLGLYSSIGKKDEVYRVWECYKTKFPSILNLGYQSMISSLIKLGDIEGAEAIYEEWMSTAANYDPRICNLMLRYYTGEGLVDKAKGVLDNFLDKGGKPKPSTWEILTDGYIKVKQIHNAFSCMKEAASNDIVQNWRPNSTNVANFLALCKEQNDTTSADMLMDFLRDSGCEREEYKALFNMHFGVVGAKR